MRYLLILGSGMKELIMNKSKTMSSAEIAQLIGKEKGNVHRDIKAQLLDGLYGLKDDSDLNHNKIQGLTVVYDGRGYWKEVLLDRYHTDILISGYEVKYRAAIVKRWQELEEKEQAGSVSLPTNYIEALEALLSSEKEKLIALEVVKQQEALIESDKPKVAFAMAVRNMQGSCSIGDLAKTLGTGRNRLYSWLRQVGILMRNNLPKQPYIERGYFVVIENIPYTDANGRTYPAFESRVTGRGQVWLEKKYRHLFCREDD